MAVATTEAVATTGEETGNIQYLTKKESSGFPGLFFVGNGEVVQSKNSTIKF